MRTIDPRCPWVTLVPSNALPRWELKDLVYQDESQSGGNHNIYLTVIDSEGAPVSGVTVWQKWPDAAPNEAQQGTLGGVANFGMYGGPFYPDRGEVGAYSSYVSDPASSDIVQGMGLPANRHVNYLLTFQLVVKDTPTPGGVTVEQVKALINEALERGKFK